MKIIYVRDKMSPTYYANAARDEETVGEVASLVFATLLPLTGVLLWDEDTPHKIPKQNIKGTVRYSASREAETFIINPAKGAAGVDVVRQAEEESCNVVVALATIYFDAGERHPVVDYIEHIKERTRLADRLVITGFTDPDITPAAGEKLALARAETVKSTLTPAMRETNVAMMTVARPLCYYGKKPDYDRRVEVSAVYLPFKEPNDFSLTSYGFKTRC